MQPAQHANRKLTATVMTILVIAGLVVVADYFKSNGTAQSKIATSQQTSSPMQMATTTTSSTPAMGMSHSAYKDGTYAATSSYFVPSGQESIDVTLTVKNGVIVGSTIKNSETDYDSAVYQESFASVYKHYVVGQQLSGLQLSGVAGASDTTQGFNDALSQITSQAQA